MSNLKKITLLAVDIAALYFALVVTLLIRYGISAFPEHFATHILPFSLIFTVWILIFYLTDLYHYKTLRGYDTLFRTVFVAVLLSGTVSTIAFYLFGDFFELTPKTNLLIFGGIFLVLDYFSRYGLLRLFTSGAIGIIILGDSPLIAETVSHLRENPTGYRVAEWIKNPPKDNFEELSKKVLERGVHLVIIQPHLTKDFSMLHLIYRLLPLEINVMNFWDFYEMIFEKVPLDELEEGWFVENITTRRPFYDAAKRIGDFSLALIAGFILLPLSLLVGLVVGVTSRGPIIYKQRRTGKNGVVFTLYKFRTMHHQSSGPSWTTPNDKRITTVGKFLRFTHLDEIPQLWNVIRGDISLIGPRPESADLVKQYKKLPHYEIRHVIKPGFTGWAQINYRPSASLEEAHEKLRYDIYYVKNRSLFLDFLIILKTLRLFFLSH